VVSVEKPDEHLSEYPVHMANPKRIIHIGIAVVGVVVGAVFAVATGGDPFALMLASGGMSGIGYWLGAVTQRKHG